MSHSDTNSKSNHIRDSGNYPVYRGVRMRNGGKWVSEIRQPRKKSRIWLGTFPSPEMAARAHDAAELCLRGNSAILNFPELADSLPRPASLSPRHVQAAAVEAAKMESPAGSEELGVIVELPSLGTNYESPEDFVFMDSVVDGWLYPPPLWGQSIADETPAPEMMMSNGLESLLWDY